MSRSMRSIHDLEEIGLSYLTGEACGYGVRALYLATAEGKKVALDLLGLPDETPIIPYDGSYTVRGQPVVGRVYLPHEAVRSAMVLGLVRRGYREVVALKDGTVVGFTPLELGGEEHARFMALHRAWGDVDRVWSPPAGQPVVGSKAVHALFGSVT